MRDFVFTYMKKRYKAEPEYPWRKYDTNAVFRHGDNKKWFALVMRVQKNKLGLEGDAYVDVINLKTDDMFFRDMLIQQEGILPAYHMNKQNWISIILDGSVPDDKIFPLLGLSYDSVAPKRRNKRTQQEDA